MKADFHAPHTIIDRFVTLLDICQRINSEKNFDELLNIMAIEAAKLICEQCSVLEECLNYALETNQEAGVWGGYAEDERRRLRKRWLAERRRRAS